MDVGQNMFLGRWPHKGIFVDRKKMYRRPADPAAAQGRRRFGLAEGREPVRRPPAIGRHRPRDLVRSQGGDPRRADREPVGDGDRAAARDHAGAQEAQRGPDHHQPPAAGHLRGRRPGDGPQARPPRRRALHSPDQEHEVLGLIVQGDAGLDEPAETIRRRSRHDPVRHLSEPEGPLGVRHRRRQRHRRVAGRALRRPGLQGGVRRHRRRAERAAGRRPSPRRGDRARYSSNATCATSRRCAARSGRRRSPRADHGPGQQRRPRRAPRVRRG